MAADILESAMIANVHRVDVAPLEQATALRELVRVHVSQGKVAKRLGKTPAWVSQRLALLELTPELQEQVETGTLKVEPAAASGACRMPKEQQAAEAEEYPEQYGTLMRELSAQERLLDLNVLWAPAASVARQEPTVRAGSGVAANAGRPVRLHRRPVSPTFRVRT
ncbi:hypothetical protein SRB5_03460 [Streptomyces sp. RB5]|uniref:ParB/Spo0J HTH domain-containing protein n=1 Tax=Streptomyces smaragdinus TaxID=2585196 RepID=A0A7K0C9W6_9ACTN|nr:hypothetical protein [Streptomyces smaragdinus]MQY10239.1 hypothetical protein [Streptomyces smaragdinus]